MIGSACLLQLPGMRPHLARWTYTGAGKVELEHRGSTSDASEDQLELSLASINRPGGIVRVGVVSSDQLKKDIKEDHKDDDDADSAISIENGEEVPPPSCIHSTTFEHSAGERQKNPVKTALVNEGSRRRKSNQGPSMLSKRSGNFGASIFTKSRSGLQSGEARLQLNASGGSATMSTRKLRKAMKTFKMSNLAGNGGSNADFGAPHLQYFLASLCDHSLSSLTVDSYGTDETAAGSDGNCNPVGLKARCPLAAEVQKLLSKLRSSQPVNAQGIQLSVAVTVLKEFLNGIPGGVFAELTEEFYQISLESTLDLTIMYLHSILHEMPYVVQQFTYLLCKALRNLIRLTGGSSLKNYTDLLMHFTPVLFPSSLGDVDKFLRAARLLLVMVDNCERVFLPLPWLDGDGNWCWHNGDFEDETFFRQIFDSLQNLEARLATDDSGVESEPEDTPCTANTACIASDSSSDQSVSNCSIADFYKVVYLDDDAADQAALW